MLKRISALTLLAAFLSVPAIADEASGLPTGKRQHKPVSAAAESAAKESEQAMNKADLTESLAKKPARSDADSDSDDMQRGNKHDAKKAARERAEEVAADHAGVHQPGGGATGQSRRRGASQDDVAEKTNKSEAARSKKKN